MELRNIACGGAYIEDFLSLLLNAADIYSALSTPLAAQRKSARFTASTLDSHLPAKRGILRAEAVNAAAAARGILVY